MTTLKTIITLILTILFFGLAVAQSDFEGTITYEVEVSNLPANQPGIENMMPTKVKMYIKDNKTCVEQFIGKSNAKNQMVSDYDAKNGFLAMDMMGQKMLIIIDEEFFKENVVKNMELTYEDLGESKDILGYQCKKAKIVNSGVEIIAYYTEQLGNKMGQELMTLPGMPLEYYVNVNGINMNFFASDIEEGEVDDDVFIKPEGYQELTMDMIKNMGGMQNFKF